MKKLVVAFALGAAMLFISRAFGGAPLYLAQAATYDVSGQTGDDTNNEMTPPEVNDTNS
jgi:hypothetical protein